MILYIGCKIVRFSYVYHSSVLTSEAKNLCLAHQRSFASRRLRKKKILQRYKDNNDQIKQKETKAGHIIQLKIDHLHLQIIITRQVKQKKQKFLTYDLTCITPNEEIYLRICSFHKSALNTQPGLSSGLPRFISYGLIISDEAITN